MDLEEELDRLYQRPLGEFIGARNELVKRLRQGGDREGAERVKALAKPSLTAWAVNQLQFRAPDELDALRAAGEELRAAHLAGAEAHRAATRARRETVSRLLALAEGVLEEAGHKPSRAHRQRISQTLEALSSQGGEAGRLSQDLDPPGFDALSSLAAALEAVPRPAAAKGAGLGPRPVPSPPAAPAGERAAAETIDFAAERRRRQDRARLARRQELERLERRLAEAREAAAEIEARVADLARRAEDARGALGSAEAAAVEAAAEADRLERRAREARERAREADAAVARERRAVEAAATAAKRAEGELASARAEVERLEDERRRLGE